MLLPNKIILLIQVYICLVDSSSVFIDDYLDDNNSVSNNHNNKKQEESYNEIDPSSPDKTKGANYLPHSPVKATIESKVLPEIRMRNKNRLLSKLDLYDANNNNNNNQVLLEPLASTGEAFGAHKNQQQLNSNNEQSNDSNGINSIIDETPQSSNSIIYSPSSSSVSTMDFEAYSVTISPTLMLNANDKDQEELEEKIEMHTNNHQSLFVSHNNQPQQTGGNGIPIDPSKSNHNTRHYTNAYHPAKLSYSSSSSIGKFPSSSSSSSSMATNYPNHNFNLNYIHNLLLTKPSQSSSSSSSSVAANSLSGLLHSLQSSSPTTSGNPSYFSPTYYSSSNTLPLTPMATSSLQQQKQSEIHQQQQQTTNNSILDLSDLSAAAGGGDRAICGRQQVAGSSREPRIVGGNNSYEGEFPWAVSIQRHGLHHCGGVIVGRRWILTAAHCVRSQLVGNLLVRTGGNTIARSANHLSSHLERDYLVDQIVMHNDFSRYDNLTATQMKSSANTNNADIALLRLKHEIFWNELAWPVCFPTKEAGNFSGHDAVVIGWGKLNEKSEEFSNELQKVKLTIIDNKVCQNWFRQAGREMPIDDRVICAGFKNGGKDACHGDSGGPLLSKINGHYAVVGVVSTGIGCARPLLPGLYSRVSSYIGWIERHIT